MQKKALNQATQADDGRYRLLVENITDYAIYMLDPAGYVSSWNAGAQRFKGYQAEEILGRHFSTFYTEEDRRTDLPARALTLAVNEGRFEHEGWRVRKDGQRFWASVIIDPIRDDDGDLVGFAKVTRDLSERKRAEIALRSSEEQFRLLVQSVTDYAIYMLDPDGRVTNWNAGAQRIKGYKPEEIIGQHFSRFYTPEDQANGEPRRALHTALHEGRYVKEAWRTRKDGSRFWASVVLDPIVAEDGTLLGFAKVTRDITEKREAERVLEQTREALFQSQKMEAIGQLTGGIAHDFNNLLGAIMGSLELALKRLPEDDAKIVPLVQNAIEGAKRGAALTQRMLAFARRQDLKLEAVDVKALFEGMAELMRRSLGPRIRLDARLVDGLPLVKADANQLEMALLNLAMNARDAMPEGGPIVIDAQVTQAEGREFLCVSVTDRGEGMDEETLKRAAEPFFTTKGVGKGTGLGLPMVAGLAAQSGGYFKLTSRKGAGTRAELWLPAVTSATPVHVPRAKSAPPSGGPLRVLAVDDDALVLMNTVAILEELGHHVTEASSAMKALEILRSGQPIDVVITDQAMPQMTGLELAGVIAREWPHTRLVLATGYSELPEQPSVNFLRLGKPFLEKDLAQALAEAPGAAA